MFPPIRAFVAILLLAFAAFFATNSLAQPAQAPVSSAQANNLEARVIADGPVRAGETLMLAIIFDPVAPEWHGYWKNPGDAGLGMQLEWELPNGWEAGEPEYPVPSKLLIANLMNHIFEGEYAVLVPVSIPADFTASGSIPIAVEGQWLACTDAICVPEGGRLTAFLTTDPAAQADPEFARWQAAIAPLLDARGSFQIANDRVRIAIPLPESVNLPAPHVFVANEQLVKYAAVQTFMREGDMLVAEIPLSEFGTGKAESLNGILAFGDGVGVRFEADRGDVPELSITIAGPAGPDTPPLYLLLLGALAGGLLLNIMPCVFPILSLKAISLARAGESQSHARREGLAYTAGVVVACLALGGLLLALRAAGENVGWAFQLQEPNVVVTLLLLAVVITVNLAGLFELPSLSFTRTGEPASAFATGLLAAFVATPCTGPFMAVALGAALLLPPAQALLLFAALGLGLALPFLLIGFVPALRAMLPKPGAWMDRFRKMMAIPMGLTALALVWLTKQLGGEGFAMFALVVTFGIVMALAVVGRLQRASKMAWPAFGLIAAPFLVFGAFALPSSFEPQESGAAQSLLDPMVFSPKALADARASGQPVFLWFTADWCVTCKVSEGVAINREVTRSAFEDAGVVAMVGDWTVRDEEITSFLTTQGVAGVPLYLWYEPGADAETLPQVLTADMLVSRAQRPR
jgi:DsbC/DsbD-like thiol-disulfide interchange protein/cytochrome c biogenesis protein CcdA